jgi:hypothetical protein
MSDVVRGDGGGGDCTPFNVSTLDAAAVEAGAAFVASRKCNNCHTEGDGGTLAGHVFAPLGNTLTYPANLTPDPKLGLGCWSNDDIQRAILTGVDDEGNPLCPPMPVFERATPPMQADEAQAIVQYLRSLAAVANDVPESMCPASDAGRGDAGGGDAGAGDAGGGDAGQDAGDGG